MMWQVKHIWNASLRLEEKDAPKKRDYIYASEIGKPFLDRYYSMIGEPVTNPFDPRVLRVFEAGHLFEWIVKTVLIRAGIFIHEEKPVRLVLGDCLPISGRLDFLAGGKPNWEETAKILEKEEYLPRNMKKVAKDMIEQLSKAYPNGLPKCILEVKSIHSLAFWAHLDQLKKAYLHHRLQLFTYIEALKIDGKVLYISKDDLCLEEVDIQQGDKELTAIMRADVEEMTKYIRTKTLPPREPDTVFDAEMKEWKANWKIERSPYLTKITGFKDKDEWSSYAEKLARKQNREVKAQEELDYYRKKYSNEYRKNIKKTKEDSDGNERGN